MEAPRLASHLTGSTISRSGSSISKCRCGPVELPRLATVAICCPALTRLSHLDQVVVVVPVGGDGAVVVPDPDPQSEALPSAVASKPGRTLPHVRSAASDIPAAAKTERDLHAWHTHLLIALSVLSIITLLLAGCSSRDTTSPRTPSVPTVQLIPELHHLHGLHINAQGTVLAGTHTGLFAIEFSGNTERVGDSDDDLMGLTGVPGTDTIRLLRAPRKSSSAPNPLGLRTSTDGGRNWTAKSLIGEVDFHALTTDGELLVGFDGGSGLITSTDGGTTWASGAALPATSLAITDTGVWAVTAHGRQRSTRHRRHVLGRFRRPGPDLAHRRTGQLPLGSRCGRECLAQPRRTDLAEVLLRRGASQP